MHTFIKQSSDVDKCNKIKNILVGSVNMHISIVHQLINNLNELYKYIKIFIHYDSTSSCNYAPQLDYILKKLTYLRDNELNELLNIINSINNDKLTLKHKFLIIINCSENLQLYIHKYLVLFEYIFNTSQLIYNSCIEHIFIDYSCNDEEIELTNIFVNLLHKLTNNIKSDLLAHRAMFAIIDKKISKHCKFYNHYFRSFI
jgi:hypothetical protein